MGDSSSENFGIAKLKGTENWTTWYDDIKSTLVLRDLWDYASGEEVELVPPTELTPLAGLPPTSEEVAA